MADEHREDGTGIGSRREARESALGILYASDRRDRLVVRLRVDLLRQRLAAVLAEVVELAGDYSTERSGRFVNGVVSRLAEELRPTVDGA